LYVALTRAREKIIITGIDKNLKKSLKEKSELLEGNNKEKGINKSIVKKAKSYLDWLEFVSLYDARIKDIMDIFEHKKDEIKTENTEEKEEEFTIKLADKVNSQIEEMLNWEYPKIELTKIEGKASVSKIAKGERVKYTVEEIVPEFIKETKTTLSGAEIGTTVHLVMQKLDFKEEYNLEKIEGLLEELLAKKIITNTQKEAVPKEKILNFTKSELFKDLKNAKEVYKEKPFYLNMPVKEIYKTDIEETILIQGIIDLYYINKNDKLILVDYKTDYVPNNNEEHLIQKYKKQLELYKKALEEALNKKVDEVYIYSTYLGKELMVTIHS